MVETGVTLAHAAKGNKTIEHKAFLPLLETMPIEGKVVTADAMFTHRDFRETVRKKKADYILIAKENQPTLRRDIAALFTPQTEPPPANGHVASR